MLGEVCVRRNLSLRGDGGVPKRDLSRRPADEEAGETEAVSSTDSETGGVGFLFVVVIFVPSANSRKHRRSAEPGPVQIHGKKKTSEFISRWRQNLCVDYIRFKEFVCGHWRDLPSSSRAASLHR